MSVVHQSTTKDLAQKVDKLNFALILLLQQLENVESVDKGVLEIVKKIISS